MHGNEFKIDMILLRFCMQFRERLLVWVFINQILQRDIKPSLLPLPLFCGVISSGYILVNADQYILIGTYYDVIYLIY